MWKRTVSRPFLSETPPNSFEFHIYLNLPEGGYPEISQQKNMFSMFMIPSRLLRHDHLLTGDNPVERPSSRSTRRVNPDFSDLCVQPGTDGLGTDTGRCRDGLVTIVPVIQLSNFWSKSISWTGGRPKLGAWNEIGCVFKVSIPGDWTNNHFMVINVQCWIFQAICKRNHFWYFWYKWGLRSASCLAKGNPGSKSVPPPIATNQGGWWTIKNLSPELTSLAKKQRIRPPGPVM